MFIVHFFPSGCSGLIAATISTPADVVKTRIMNNPNVYRGSIDCFLSAVCKLHVDCYMTARDTLGRDVLGKGDTNDGTRMRRDTRRMGSSREGTLEGWDTQRTGYSRDRILEGQGSLGIGHPGDGTLEGLELELDSTGTACTRDSKRGVGHLKG